MTEYIERGAFVEACLSQKAGFWMDLQDQYKAITLAGKISAADVEPVVHGEWKWKPPYMVCSVCSRHAINRYRSKYCQHCGAKMNNPRGAHMDERSEGK